jgi:protocatechuate 3,4-dioxygenase beta subunit
MRMFAHIAAMLFPTAAAAILTQRPAPRYALGADEGARAAVQTRRASSAAVAGRILDCEGRALAGAKVHLLAGDRESLARTETDGDGRYHFERAPSAGIRIVAEDEGAGYVESAELDAAAAMHAVLVLEAANAFDGVVTDDRGVPVPHATVKAWGQALLIPKVVITDDDGRYRLPIVPAAAEHLSVWAAGFDPTTIDLGPAARRARAAPVQRDIHLNPAVRLRGAVVDGLGRPVEGAQITACPGPDQEGAISGHFGEFTLSASTVGCSVGASHPRFASSRPAIVRADRTTSLQLGTGGAIEGLAVDERGRPLAAFSLSIQSFEPAEGEPQTSSRAGEAHDELRGRFRFDDLTPGTYVLGVNVEGRGFAQSAPIEVGRGRVVRGVRIGVGEPDAVQVDEGPGEGVSGDVPASDGAGE